MPGPYGDVTAAHKLTYNENVMLALQQMDSRFEQSFSFIPGLKGKDMQAVELIGTSEAQEDLGDTQATPNIAPKHSGIHVRPRRISWGRSIPDSTAVLAAIDYQSPYVQEGAAAMRRGKDKRLAEAIFGPRLVAATDFALPTPVVFPTSQRLAVDYGAAGPVGLTFKKLVGAIQRLIDAEVNVDYEDLWCPITGKQNENLYNELQVTSADYTKKTVLEGKTVKEFMQIKFFTYTQLPRDVNNYRRVPLYCKSGLHYGDAMPMKTMIERNPALQYQLHPFMDMWVGATRSEDEKVVEILCTEV